MTRSGSKSLALPIVVLVVSGGSAAFAGHAWWQQKQDSQPAAVRTMPVPAPPSPQRTARVPSVVSSTPPRVARTGAADALRKCIGADGVPVYTNHACPAGSTLAKTMPVELPRNARPAMAAYPASSPAGRPAGPVLRYPAPGYPEPYIPPREQREKLAIERAFDACEAAKLDEKLALKRLGNERTLRDIRRWGKRTADICAEYKLLTAR